MGLRTDIEDRIVPSYLLDRLKGVAAWRTAGLTMAVGLLALFTLYGETVGILVRTWSGSDTFNHCFLIPPISLYLIWRSRERLFAVTPKPFYPGILLIVLAGMVWLTGDAAGVAFVEEVSLVTMILGLHLTICGTRATRVNLFPLVYLYVAVPMGAFLIPPLQTFTADSAVFLLRLVGVPVFMEGNYITIPNGVYFVAEACAGLRFLIATATLGVLFGYLYYRSAWRWMAFMALSFVLPVLANAVRAFGIILLGYHTSSETAGGFDHIFTGWIFFALVTLGFLAIGYSFSDRKSGGDEPDKTELPRVTITAMAPRQILLAAVVAVAVAIIPSAYGAYIDQQTTRVAIPQINAPSVSAPWSASDAVETDWLPHFVGLDAVVLKSYRTAEGTEADLFIGYYARQRDGSDVLSYYNKIADDKVWRVVNHDSVSAMLWGHDTVVREARLDRGAQRRLVRYWYWVDGEFTASPYWAKILFARSKLFGGIQGSAVIAASVAYDTDVSEARARLDDFLAHVAPLGDELMAASGGPKD